MKKNYLPWNLLFCLAFLYNGLLAQVTITQDDFPRQASFSDTFVIANNTPMIPPTHGTDQTWDFSSATEASVSINEYMDATADPNFPNALNYRERDLSFQGFVIESDEYESIDADGWYTIGRSIVDVTYSITVITGGPSDNLRFVGGNYIYPGEYKQLQFPLNYQDQWTINYQQDIDFELTVAAFGLNSVPGIFSRYFTQHRQVVGEGTVIIPDENGDPSWPIDALLIKAVRTAVDSTFLGGNPAPPPLMAAFGLTQGSVAADSFYVVYAPGFGSTLLSVDIEGTQISNLVYRPGAASLGTPSAVKDLWLTNFSIAPNPVSSGNPVQINTTQSVSINAVQIVNLLGQVIYEKREDNSEQDNFSVMIPQNTPTGIYLLIIKDKAGKVIGSEKIQVNQ